ncbi:hypothetical protein ACKAV7_011591 [Fusarium commune]
MNYDDSPAAHGHGAPMMHCISIPGGVEAAWNYFQFRTLSYLKCRWGNVLPALGLEILGSVLEAILNANSINSWRRISILVESDIRDELRRLSAEEETLNNQIRAQLPFYRDQSAEFGLAVIPSGMLHDRNNRRKALLGLQKRATRINARRILHHRALWYIGMFE